MNIGKTVKILRREKNLNQREFAEVTGLTQTSISQIESNKKKPNPKTLNKICEYFKINEALFYLLCIEATDMPESNWNLSLGTQFYHYKDELIKLLSK